MTHREIQQCWILNFTSSSSWNRIIKPMGVSCFDISLLKGGKIIVSISNYCLFAINGSEYWKWILIFDNLPSPAWHGLPRSHWVKLALRRLTACQYCHLRTRFSQSVMKPKAFTEHRHCQICFHHSTACNGSLVIWDKRHFNHEFFTFMSACHSGF